MMYSCTIIISSYESLPFLRVCIHQLRKHKHKDVEQKIIISEQSTEEEYAKVVAEFGGSDDIKIVRMKAICSGYGTDFIMRYHTPDTEYTCTLDVDSFVIHNNWLITPIKVIEHTGCAYAGHHSFLENAYKQYGQFYHMTEFFRVGKTATFKEASFIAGFTKYTHRYLIDDGIVTFENDSWGDKARELGEDGWADSSVVALWWGDQNRIHNKVAFAVNKCLGITNTQGNFGICVDDLVLHFTFSYTHKLVGDKLRDMGEDYIKWIGKINSNFDVAVLDEMIRELKPIGMVPREMWDGASRTSMPTTEEINNFIEKTKNE